METIKIEKKSTLMVAHRGVSNLERENTLASFILASSKSYYGIETDIHVTKDNKFIVSHDSNTYRVSGINLEIEESTFEEIRKIRIYDLDGTYNKNQYFPSLEEYLNILKTCNKIGVLELKGNMKEEHIKDILNIINNIYSLDKMIIISFHKNNLLYAKKNNPNGKYQYLNNLDSEEERKETIRFAIENQFDVDVNYCNINQEFIDRCHKNNVKVNVYTVNDSLDANRLIEMGVDYITSNILE